MQFFHLYQSLFAIGLLVIIGGLYLLLPYTVHCCSRLKCLSFLYFYVLNKASYIGSIQISLFTIIMKMLAKKQTVLRYGIDIFLMSILN